MAKRERDGWRVEKDTADEFELSNGTDRVRGWISNGNIAVIVKGRVVSMPPARAAQFAAKVQEIAAKAAKEAKDGRC